MVAGMSVNSPEDIEDQSRVKSMKQSLPRSIFQAVFRRPLRSYLWVLIVALWIMAFTLGFVGLRKAALSQGDNPTTFDLIYKNLQLVTLESGSVPGPVPWELEVARFALPALAAYTAIQALAVLFREQTQVLRLWFMRDHVVICGLSRKGLLLAKTLLVQKYKVVVIEQDESSNQLEQVRTLGGLILNGDATDPAVLQRASVDRAKFLIGVCGDDGTNAEIAVQAQNLLANLDRDPLTCFVHIVDSDLCELLRENEIKDKRFRALRLELFNVYERGAQLLLDAFPPFELIGEREGRPSHILLVGMGKMGENFLTRTVYAWWMNRAEGVAPLRITIVDLEAEEKLKSLRVRHPHLMDRCQVSALSLDVTCSDFLKSDLLVESSENGADIAYICFDNDALGLNVGLTLARNMKNQGMSIIVRMAEERGLALLLGKDSRNETGFPNLHAFNLINRTCNPELLFGGIHEMLARSVHENYVREQKSLDQSRAAKEVLVPWDQLPEKIKESNRRNADHISVKLRSVGCTLIPLRDWDSLDFHFSASEVEQMARMEHERWVRDRKREGWIFAEERDDGEKRHPSLVDWEDLPDDEREKNRAFIRDFPRILARAGFQIQRSI